MSRALIFGVGGQDGSYLAELLLDKGYDVYGVYPYGGSLDNLKAVATHDRLHLIKGDVSDPHSVSQVVRECNAYEIYNLADVDDVSWSYKIPNTSMLVTAGGIINIMEAVLELTRTGEREPRIFQPLSALMFGPDVDPPQYEDSPLNPRSPYAAAKASSWMYSTYYRKYHNLFVSCGIFFNHTSPRQRQGYLLDKICKGATAIREAKQNEITLGSLEQKVDIGHAKDYVKAAWMTLQHSEPDDFIIASGTTRTIRQLVEWALNVAGLDVNVDKYVTVDPSVARPGKQPTLHGNIEKIRRDVGWDPGITPEKIIAERILSMRGVL